MATSFAAWAPRISLRVGQCEDERSGPIERVVEHRSKVMTQARPRLELARGQASSGFPQELDPRERIRLAGQQQRRAGDVRPMGNPRHAVGMARPVKWIGKADQPSVRATGDRKACDSSAVRLAAHDDIDVRWRDGQKRRNRVLRTSLRNIDRQCVHSSCSQASRERLHGGSRSGRARSKIDTHGRHNRGSVLRPVRGRVQRS
jgi:hypothetical protein